MDRRTFVKSTGALLLVEAGCTAGQQIADSSPPAKTPLLKTLSSVVPRTVAWTDFTARTDGNFELLPSGHPNGDIRVVFSAPYPSKVRVDVDNRFFLREPDQDLSPGEGHYKINSIVLAEAKDTFDWDVTVTPPASVRVEPQFRINIANVSINPAYSGIDQTSAPLGLPLVRAPVADLDAWLDANTSVRDAIVWEDPGGAVGYSSWWTQRKDALRTAFDTAWNTKFTLLEDPPRNTATLGDTDKPVTVISEADAWPLFIMHIAYNLAVEIGGWTSWSVTGYSQDQLQQLFDSRQMFRWDNARQGYDVCDGSGPPAAVVPASPWTTLLFLYENGIYTSRSRLDVINRMLEWCRQNLSHFIGGFEAKNMQDQWQYRGCPPVFRIIQGTPAPNLGEPSIAGVMHRTAGCWGTTGFLRATLRVLNIPVKLEKHVGHALPSFVTEGLYLSHGDDPYSQLSKATPSFPANELLIDQAKFDQWFGNNVAATEQTNNVGRRTLELAIKYLPGYLLKARCQDPAGVANADSKVFETFKDRFTVAELEAQNLWTRIDAKITSLGGCAEVLK